MKTRKEAAKEYANIRARGVFRHDAEMAFKSGVEFAQTWFSTRDTPPEVGAGTVILKHENQYVIFHTDTQAAINYIQSDWSFWRPVEYK
jgi:uncharacterized protein YbdZ (MbtH family)